MMAHQGDDKAVTDGTGPAPAHEIGASVPGKGVYVGIWTPLTWRGEALSRQFHVYAAPEKVARGCELAEAFSEVAGLRDFHGHDGIKLRDSEAIFRTARDNPEKLSHWFLPTADIMSLVDRAKFAMPEAASPITATQHAAHDQRYKEFYAANPYFDFFSHNPPFNDRAFNFWTSSQRDEFNPLVLAVDKLRGHDPWRAFRGMTPHGRFANFYAGKSFGCVQYSPLNVMAVRAEPA